MTSQLNVETIVDKAGSSGPSLPNTTTIKIGNTSTTVGAGGSATINTEKGLTKAWCFGTQAAVITNSFNVSSGTDNGTGDYSYTLSITLASANLAAAGSANDNADRNVAVHSPTATSYRIEIYNQNGTDADVSNRTIVCGDLA